jgi:hypothetical protein
MRVSWLGCVISALGVTMAFGQSTATQSTTIHLANGETAQDLQEIIQTLFAVSDIRLVSIDSAGTDLVASGTADQIAFAQWLIGELDKPAAGPAPVNSAQHEYRMQGSADDVVRVFYLTQTRTQQNLQQVMTLIRAMEDIRRLYPYLPQQALTVRGTAAQISLAAWLVNELDKPASAQSSAAPGPLEYLMPGQSDGVVRLFYLSRARTPQELEDTMTAVRAATNARRLFVNGAQKVLAVRGTASQIAIAERVINDRR